MGKGRAPCCDKSQVKKGPWSPAEDLKLIAFIQKYGHENWRALPKQAGLQRCGKSCRLRWINYLRPDVKRGNFTAEEEENIIRLHKDLGNKWSKIASRLPGRTDNEIKNVWNTHLKKRLASKSSESSADESNSKLESSVTSPSSSSSESFFSSETPNNPAKSNSLNGNEVVTEQASQVITLSEKIDQDSGKQQSNEPVGITEDPKGSSISLSSAESNVLNSSHVVVEYKPEQQQLQLDSPLLTYLGPYDVDTTLEEVDKPNQPIEIPWDLDSNFWKLLDGLDIEPFVTTCPEDAAGAEAPKFGDGSVQDAEANRMWSQEFENEFGVVGETIKESNKDPFPPNDYQGDQQGMDQDAFDLDLVTMPESELDLGYIQLWPSWPHNTNLYV